MRTLHILSLTPTLTLMNAGIFVSWNIRSHDGTFVLETIRSLELSFSRLFVLWNIRSLDRSFPGTFVPETNKHCRHFPPRTIHSLDRSFPETFVPGTWTFPAADHSFICLNYSESHSKVK